MDKPTLLAQDPAITRRNTATNPFANASALGAENAAIEKASFEQALAGVRQRDIASRLASSESRGPIDESVAAGDTAELGSLFNETAIQRDTLASDASSLEPVPVRSLMDENASLQQRAWTENPSASDGQSVLQNVATELVRSESSAIADLKVSDQTVSGLVENLHFSGVSNSESTSLAHVQTANGQSGLSSVIDAQQVAMMMSQLERTPQATDGQWQFEVLNDDTSVAQLFLQRTEQGAWDVGVSMQAPLPQTSHDIDSDAEELRQVLLGQGFDIASVKVGTRQSTAQVES